MWCKQIMGLIIVCGLSWHSALAAEIPTPQPSRPTFLLQDILALALEKNPLVTESEGFIEQKEGSKISASAYPNPTLSFQSGRGTVRDPSVGISITERYVTLSQPLEWPGKREARQQAAQAGVEGAMASKEEAKLNLIAATKQAFYDLLLAERQKEMAVQNVQTMKEVREAVIRRVDAGEAPPFEAVKVKVEDLKVQKEVARAKGLVQSFQAALNSLTAGALGPDFFIQGDFAGRPETLPLTTLSEQALTHHPVIMKWQKLVEEAQQTHRQEQQARMPNVTLSGSYQRDAGREAYVAGLSIPFPVWDQRQGDIAQAKGTLRQREAMLLRAKHELLKGVTQQIQLSQAAAAQIATYEKGLLKQAEEALRIAQVSFKFGETSLLDVLDAQRVLRQTQVDYAQAQYDLSIALTELERVTGGITLP
ncbi:MAG: TolC family protein [Nitrospira sp.]|nr:TolC family protein [Nitrospira sp.]HNP30488.1 TolC family protein [Nitrospirales bacterium]